MLRIKRLGGVVEEVVEEEEEEEAVVMAVVAFEGSSILRRSSTWALATPTTSRLPLQVQDAAVTYTAGGREEEEDWEEVDAATSAIPSLVPSQRGPGEGEAEAVEGWVESGEEGDREAASSAGTFHSTTSPACFFTLISSSPLGLHLTMHCNFSSWGRILRGRRILPAPAAAAPSAEEEEGVAAGLRCAENT
jgi:hypothetical protein